MTEETAAQQPSKAEEAAIVQDSDAFMASLRSEINADKETLTLKPAEAKEEAEEEEEAPAITAEDVEDAEEADEPEPEEEEAEPQGKKKPGEIKRMREKLKAEEAEKEAMKARVRELEALIMEKLAPEKKEEVDDFEPIDAEAQARVDKKLTAIEQKQEMRDFQRAVATEDAIQGIKDKDWEAKKTIVIESEALDMLNRGRASTHEEAIKLAKASVSQDMFAAYQKGLPVADYFNKRATFAVQKLPKNERTSEKKVDMAKLDKLRKEAGAPTNKVATSKTSGGDLWAELRSEIEADKKRSSASAF